MKKSIQLILLAVNCYTCCIAQQMHEFEIVGSMNTVSSNKIYLEPIVFNKKFSSVVVNDSASIRNNTFHFKGLLSYPHPFKLSCYDSLKNRTTTEMFFVQQGKQYIHIDSLRDNMLIDVANSSSNTEFISMYYKKSRAIAKEWEQAFYEIDSVSDYFKGNVPDSIMLLMRSKEDSLQKAADVFIFDYTKENPNSYVALWKLLQKFYVLGYTSLYLKTYSLLSDSIKRTNTAKELLKAIKIASVTGVGNDFPQMRLVNTYDERTNLKMAAKKHKYVLLDFWYSHCRPCIEQFPQLKTTYNKFKNLGFEILSISTDKQTDKQDWKNAISKYQLTWKHLWDINGIQTKKLSINMFPTNFLLDSNNKIIAKNIDIVHLNKFLKDNLFIDQHFRTY